MNILLPVDFSPTAKNTVLYASALAQAINASIHLVHVVEAMPGQSEAFSYYEEEQSTARNQLNQWKKTFEKDFKVNYSCRVRFGNLTEEIKRVEETLHPELIVMGTTGAKGLRKYLWGSNTISVIENASAPVLAIPQDLAYATPKKIVYATDYNESSLNDLKELATLAEVMEAEILVVHIKEPTEAEAEDEKDFLLNREFSEMVKKNVPYHKISFRVSENISTHEGIKQFVEKERAEILAIATRKRNLFQKVISKSLTKDFVSDIEFPVMAFHVTNKKEILTDS